MRSDHDPARVRSAIVREALSFLAHGVLYPLGGGRAAPAPVRRREQRTLVFVHGLGANPAGFLPLQAWLRLHGHRRTIALGYGGGSIEAMALKLKRDVDAAVGGGRVDVVAHSMGGLVARAYLQLLGGARRVDRLVTLGTPHHGTHAANFIPSALVRQLLPESPFLSHLNAQPPPEGVRATSVVAGRDLLIQPVESARCPFGEHVVFDDLGHVELLFRPEVFAEVAARLRASERALPAQL
ncbi:MAG TPA: alpha/beta fold hydrolase [Myxococcota bacterium]|nr:alpha/beta fold hydrolase [Myxococcota bacterium]